MVINSGEGSLSSQINKLNLSVSLLHLLPSPLFFEMCSLAFWVQRSTENPIVVTSFCNIDFFYSLAKPGALLIIQLKCVSKTLVCYPCSC